jgi:PAS domain S-box-containing protein
LLNIAGGQLATIIENIRLQEEIKQSEEKYRTVVEGALDGVLVVGDGYQIKYVNERLAEIVGYPREELIGMDFRNYLDDESRQLVIDRYVRRQKGEEVPPRYEFNVVQKNREIRNVEISSTIVKDSQGNVNTIAFLKDITDRKQAEEALQRSEETATRLAQENAIMAEIGRIISSTLNIEEVYERFAEEARKLIPFDRIAISLTDLKNNTSTTAYLAGIDVLGRGPADIIPMAGTVAGEVTRTRSSLLIQGDNINEVASRFPALLPTFQAGLRSMIFVPLMSKDQVIGVLSLRSLVPKAYTDQDVRLAESIGDQIAGAIANAQLFMEREQAEEALRQSEERYRTILENIQEGYFEVNLAGNFTFVNDAECRNLGYTKDELIGMNNRQYADEKSARELYHLFNEVYRTGEPVKGYDLELIKKDGIKVFNEISVSLIRGSEGKPIGFRGIARDVTEKKKMEEKLLQNEKLRALGEMASGVAHDFNNALAAILGNTQLLLYTTKDEELKGSLKVIEKVAWDSAQTVRRLQDFTRKSVHQELFKVDVNSIIKDSIEITKPKWKDEVQSRGIHIEMVSNFEEIPTVIGSTSELREVITNMIFNAIEAMPEGGKIEIRTFQRKSNVFIQISDSGIGMTEEVKKKAFEPFFTTKPFSNTGLGLSMSYGVIKRFGGEIEVESKVGHGTTFTIILPIGLEGKEEVDVSPIIKKGREARILVIDDEETVRSVLSQILSQVNHQVTVAENGEEGIRLFREKDFDLVLTDLGMPGMSGWEVCRAIKKMSSHIPVGMITGWGIEVDQAKIEENGIDFVIPKPFQFDQILKVVDETIASRGSHL